MKKQYPILFCLFCLLILSTCTNKSLKNADAEIEYCISKARLTIEAGFQDGLMPRSIKQGDKDWTYSRFSSWTSGYWPGILWLISEYTGDEYWIKHAKDCTEMLFPNEKSFYNRNSFGLSIMLSYGHAFRATQDTFYANIIADAARMYYQLIADTPVAFFEMNGRFPENHYQNDLNLSLHNLALMASTVCPQSKHVNDFALQKAIQFIKIINDFAPLNHRFSKDSLLSANYNKTIVSQAETSGLTDTHPPLQAFTIHNIAWLMYGFVSFYELTSHEIFLNQAKKLANIYIKLRQSQNQNTFMNNINLMGAEHMATMAIAASSLIKLSMTDPSTDLAQLYTTWAEETLKRLSSPSYRPKNKNMAFLTYNENNYSANHKPDISLIYADYYYLEALILYTHLKANTFNLQI